MIPAKFRSALFVNSLRDEMPDQSGHLSCSMENERRVLESGSELDGGDTGTDTSTAYAIRNRKAKSPKVILRRIITNSRMGHREHYPFISTKTSWL